MVLGRMALRNITYGKEIHKGSKEPKDWQDKDC